MTTVLFCAKSFQGFNAMKEMRVEIKRQIRNMNQVLSPNRGRLPRPSNIKRFNLSAAPMKN
jgi:hypothetical protein